MRCRCRGNAAGALCMLEKEALQSCSTVAELFLYLQKYDGERRSCGDDLTNNLFAVQIQLPGASYSVSTVHNVRHIFDFCPRDAMRKRGLCCRRVSGRPSVTRRYSV